MDGGQLDGSILSVLVSYFLLYFVVSADTLSIDLRTSSASPSTTFAGPTPYFPIQITTTTTCPTSSFPILLTFTVTQERLL
jgi:hypothetical protein